MDVLERIAPPRLAQAWDNVGLIGGDARAAMDRCLLCIDLTPAVVSEAVRHRCQAIVSYHPPIFKAIKSISVQGDGREGPTQALFRAISAGIAVYSPHTALDASMGGTGDAMAALAGARIIGPIDPERTGEDEVKVTVFVPPADVSRLSEAMFAAGGGRIGLYEKCSFRIPGTGTFWGTEGTNPQVGTRGRLETVEEVRLEMVCSARNLAAVVQAIRATHPYEEPAYDVYSLTAKPSESRGLGRLAELARPEPLGRLAARLARAVGGAAAQIVGEPKRRVRTLAILVGAAGRIDNDFPRSLRADVLVTGEIRHHDALAFRARGWSAIALGHWASERPVLAPLATSLQKALPKLRVRISSADADPLATVAAI